jgi:hypothetical protein
MRKLKNSIDASMRTYCLLLSFILFMESATLQWDGVVDCLCPLPWGSFSVFFCSDLGLFGLSFVVCGALMKRQAREVVACILRWPSPWTFFAPSRFGLHTEFSMTRFDWTTVGKRKKTQIVPTQKRQFGDNEQHQTPIELNTHLQHNTILHSWIEQTH